MTRDWIKWSLKPDSLIVFQISDRLKISNDAAFAALSRFVWIVHRHGKPSFGYTAKIGGGPDGYLDAVCAPVIEKPLAGFTGLLQELRLLKRAPSGDILILVSPLFPFLQTPAEIRYSRIRAARRSGRHTKEQWAQLVSLVEVVCPRCLKPTNKLTKDHIVPVASGGSDAIENLQPLCTNCNCSKGTERIDWMARRGLRMEATK